MSSAEITASSCQTRVAGDVRPVPPNYPSLISNDGTGLPRAPIQGNHKKDRAGNPFDRCDVEEVRTGIAIKR